MTTVVMAAIPMAASIIVPRGAAIIVVVIVTTMTTMMAMTTMMVPVMMVPMMTMAPIIGFVHLLLDHLGVHQAGIIGDGVFRTAHNQEKGGEEDGEERLEHHHLSFSLLDASLSWKGWLL